MKKINLILALFICLISYNQMNAQCINTSAFGTATAPTEAGTVLTISTATWAGDYNTINVSSGDTYNMTSSIATDFLTATDAANNVIATGTGSVSATATTGQLRLHVNTGPGCGTNTVSRTTTVECTSCPPPAPPPANDVCSGAIDLGITPGSVSGTTAGSATNAGAPGFCGTSLNTAAGVWYQFTPIVNGTALLDLCGSSFDTKMGVFEGPCGSLTCIAGEDDDFLASGCGGNDPFLGNEASDEVAVVAGTTYYVYVTGFSTSEGTFTLNFDLPTCELIAPAPVTVSIDPGTCEAQVTLEVGGAASGTGGGSSNVQVGNTINQLPAELKSNAGFCPTTPVSTGVCDCPTGFVAVGYSGITGNSYGNVISQFSLQCKEVLPNGDLGTAVTVTCSNGTLTTGTASGPLLATGNDVLVGAQANIGCAIDGIMGFSKPISEILAGGANTNSSAITTLGGMGGSPNPASYVPAGSVIVGMETFEDPSPPNGTSLIGVSAGFAWRYASLSGTTTGGPQVGCTNITNDFNGGGANASGLYPVGETTVTWTSGTSVVSTTVTVVDVPAIDCPDDMTIHLDPGACEAVLSYDVEAISCSGSSGLDFTGGYDVANWTFNGVSNSSVNTAGAPSSIVITGDSNGGGGGAAEFCITILESGPLSFDWSYTTTDSPFWDPFRYSVNGVETDVTTVAGGNNQSGTISLNLNAGDVFCFNQFSLDGILGAGITTISNFMYTSVPPFAQIISGIASGEGFPIGVNTVTWGLYDNTGALLTTCDFSVTVNEFQATSNDITCNSLVNISLDENCEAVVGADQILEGNNYGCYDNFDVTFADTGLPLILNSTHVGETIEVMVTNPSGNPCWGYILVEDKIAPTITCYDVDLECDEALPTEPAPNFSQAGTVMTIAEGGNGNAAGGAVYFTITNSSLFPIEITAFDMNIDGATFVDVYTTPGGHAGNETNAGAWTLAGQLDANTGPFGPFTGPGPLTNAPVVGGTISIAPGSTGIALHALTAMQSYTNGNGANQSFTDGVVTLDLGTSGNTLFGGVFDPRVFNGAVYYEQNIPQVVPTDACGAVTVTFTDVVEDLGCNASGFSEIITRTWTATDPSGNSSSCTSTYRRIIQTLDDIVADLPTDITLECGDALPAPLTDIGCDNIGITLDGTPPIIDICEGSYKMLRQYVIVDWCTNETIEHLQIIKVLDTGAPTLDPITDITISTNSNDCFGSVQLPTVTATDACSSATVSATSASAGDLVGNTIQNLPVGTHTVTYTATDGCGNEAEGTLTITVEDQIAPIAICDEFTIVGIGSDGNASVNAITFDDGSTDNCGIVEMLVRRMDNPDCPGFDATPFGPSVPFTCCDVNTTVMVEFQVKDAAGNVNSCMVEVEVQDKINPVIVCAPNADIDCTADYLADITVGQPLPQSAIDANGEALATDNCPGVVVTNSVISNTVDCGAGTITIVWTATDAVNRTASCIQRYFVTNSDPFVEGDITWPLDYTANTCGTGLEPSDLSSPYNYPVLEDANCSNIAVGHDDQVLDFGAADACLKILRKWYVIDWCQATANQDPTQPGPGVWHYTQIIKVINSTDPNITAVNLPSVVDNFDADCGEVTATFEISADDDCTAVDDLDVTWEFSTGLSGTGFTASGDFLNGSYSVTFTVDDQCGNSSTLEHNFTVVDAKKPTPVCIFGIATTVMPSAGAVTIWASDFESGSSYDNCTAYEDLEFSFSQDVTETSITITCDDIPADGLFPITIYVTDEAGNFDFCSTFVNVQDPTGACGIPTGLITGTIENENQEVIEEVVVTLTDINGTMPGVNPVVTGANGVFEFNMNSGDYDVTPAKDINYLNGVTTYDLVLISKHILGTQLLDSPYKMIAADANNTQSITTLDIVKLRALILHIDDELANNTSWRFVDQDHVFGTNVFDFPEYIALGGSTVPANFVAMKIGDVNGTASPNSLLGSDTRTFAGDLALSLEATQVAAGETFTVDFKANDFKNIAGYQFTLGFDNSVEFVDVTSNLAGLSTANFGLTKLAEGAITTSWNSNEGVTVANGETLFSMTFRANAAVNTKEVLSINSRYTESEAYNGSDLYNVVLEFNGTSVSNGFELFQNTPNPFKAETTIGFNMPAAGAVTLTIYDVSGRVLRLIEMDAVKGANSVNVSREGIDATGVLYYQLETATETATKKMILVD